MKKKAAIRKPVGRRQRFASGKLGMEPTRETLDDFCELMDADATDLGVKPSPLLTFSRLVREERKRRRRG